MFLLTAAIVYSCGIHHWRAIRPLYTATAYVVEQPANERMPFTATDVDADQAVESAENQARQFAAARQSQWRQSLDVPRQKALEAVENARRDRNECENRLSVFEQQRTATATIQHENTARPAAVENPQWIDLKQQLTYLERRRVQLLVNRTPEHPAVRECVERIAAIQMRMAAIPQFVGGGDTKLPAPAAAVDRISVEDFERKHTELSVAAVKSRAALTAAERDLREIVEKQQRGAVITVEPAAAVANPVETAAGWRRLLWTMFSAASLMAFGVGAFALGLNIQPPFANVQEIEDELSAPLLGVVPCDEPAADAEEIRNQMNTRWTAFVAGAVSIAACLLVAAGGVSGM